VRRNVTNTRARILEASVRLFDLEGVRGATLDAIAALAGVTKRTLYHHFRSKDDLIASFLSEGCMAERRDLLIAKQNAAGIDEMVERVFASVAHSAADPRWKGCLFTRAAVELAGLPGHPAIAAAKAEKNLIEQIFTVELHSIEIPDPQVWARRLIILLDGAISHSIVHHDPLYATEAGRMALELLTRAKLTMGVKASGGRSAGRPAAAEREAFLPTENAEHANRVPRESFSSADAR
jgi:AcrR family transcriptional regulator